MLWDVDKYYILLSFKYDNDSVRQKKKQRNILCSPSVYIRTTESGYKMYMVFTFEVNDNV